MDMCGPTDLRVARRRSEMKDPIQHLLDEHVEIMAEIHALRAAVDDLRRRGEPALAAALPVLGAVGRMMTTRLLLHARKEDEALFPAIEQALGAPEGPTSVMRDEHRAIHDRVRLYRDTLHELNEVEHPAIVAGGERLRSLAERSGSVTELADTGATILELLDAHFGKEEAVLFPMAREMLSARELGEIADRMAAIERDA